MRNKLTRNLQVVGGAIWLAISLSMIGGETGFAPLPPPGVPSSVNRRAGSFTAELRQIYRSNYPKELSEYFCSLGTNPTLGFRWAGTSAEVKTGLRIEQELKSCGLSNVRREPVPADVIEFKKAEITVNGRRIHASAFTGVPPTGSTGLVGEVVYAHDGTKADFESLGKVQGKIV